MSDNKKGSVEDAVAFVIFVFIAFFAVFLFKVNEKIKSNALIEDIQNQKDAIFGHETLMEYFSAIDSDGNKKADLVSKSFIGKNFDDLKKDMQDYFGKKLANLPIWYVDLTDSSGSNIFTIESGNYYTESQNYKLSNPITMLVPVNTPEKTYIQVKLILGR